MDDKAFQMLLRMDEKLEKVMDHTSTLASKDDVKEVEAIARSANQRLSKYETVARTVIFLVTPIIAMVKGVPMAYDEIKHWLIK